MILFDPQDTTTTYTPFPGVEREGRNIFRTTFMLAGQTLAVSTRTGTTGTPTYYYLFNDHPSASSGRAWAVPAR